MPHYYISTSRVLGEIDDVDIEKEYDRRRFNKVIGIDEAKDCLINSSDYLREQGRNDLALRLDDIRKEFT